MKTLDITVNNPHGKHFKNQEERVLAYVRYYQYLNVTSEGETNLITIAELKEKTRLSKKLLLDIADSCDKININIALGCGGAMADLEVSEYSLEDLDFWEQLGL
jgi:hypothetical protein